jgi:hypothetical protein
MTRYKPSFSVLLNGTEANQDTMRVDARTTITNQVGTFELEVDDRFDKWNALQWNHPAIITLDGTRILKGRVDEPRRAVDKKNARVITLTGREDGGALQDIVTSKHFVNQDVNSILTNIINTYNSMRYASDPAITVGSILPAPGTISMSFLWKRKSLWQMLIDVANALGAPVALGGLDTFYDFYVDPFDNFFFEPTGQHSSGIDLGGIGGPEIKKREWVIDSLTAKNDVWVWGDGSAGTLPLEMQTGYTGPGARTDPWSEGNAADFGIGPNVDTIADDATQSIIGSKSIKISTLSILGSPSDRIYWYMPFPFGSGKWPGQDPNGVLNAYNELSMTETMGELTGIGFFIQTEAGNPFDLLVEVKDFSNKLGMSNSVHIEPGGKWFSAYWNYVQLPFGPSASYKNAEGNNDSYDWTSIKEVRFVVFNFPLGLGTLNIWFDGLRFIKPLVVNKAQGGQPSRRTHVAQASHISSYPLAVIYAQALLENMMNPQQYYEINNIGRADIPAGYKFTAEAKTLLAREIRYQFTKDEGWLIDLTGFEQT